ncbi:MAG: NlpC/P60 family protein [Streptomycetaceae bacterium]|nr:MAG: NlpC/P60 family protein [Streptomycetaceae bacterium]
MKNYRAISLALIVILTLSTAPAVAKTPKPTLAQIEAAKKAEAAKKKAADEQAAKLAKANQSLRTLTAKANAATALYVKAQKELAIAEAAARAAAQYAAETAAAVQEAHKVIGKLAANAYILGGNMSDIEPLLSANGPQDLMDQLSTLSTLGSKNTIALERFKAAEVIARAAKKAADEAKIAQQKATEKVAAAKKVADDAKADQAKEVAKLQKIQDQLMKELMSARKIRTTLEQQRQLALLEEAQANQAEQTVGQSKIWPDIGFKGRSTIRTSEAQRLKAVEFAKKQVLARKPYVWGTQGPNTFDCSGLVYAAYKYAGLDWPNWDRLNSALYSGYTKHVSLNALVPGDLLFYSYKGTISTIHHITIYAGDGMMWEANSKNAGLLYSSIYSVKGLMPFGGRV